MSIKPESSQPPASKGVEYTDYSDDDNDYVDEEANRKHIEDAVARGMSRKEAEAIWGPQTDNDEE